jgi:metal-sulfur cluster biosynthetic enzyme
VTGITVNDATIANGDTTVNVTTTTTAYSAGTIVTFAGCYAVNEETKVAYSHLKQFVVVSATATALTIDPPVYTSGAKQNCSAVPTNGGAVTVSGAASGTYPQHLAFHKNWATLATCDLEDVSRYGAWGAREVYDGISIRLSRQWQGATDTQLTRLDVLYGVKQLRGQLACRITG